MATLADLIAHPDLKLRLVQQGAGNPDITWVSTTELLNLGTYLDGGEIVLTTGLALSDNDPRWLDFVASLSRARVTAIGFGVGVSHDRIPPPLVAAASTYRVALFEVPPPTPFIAVSKAAAALLHADELRGARQAIHTHQRLLEGVRDNHDVTQLLASIANATNRALAVHGSGGELLARSAGYDTTRDSASTPHDTLHLDAHGATLSIAPGAPMTPGAQAVLAAGALVLGITLSRSRSSDTRDLDRWARLTDALTRETIDPRACGIIEAGLTLPESIRAIGVHGTAEDVAAWRRAPRLGFTQLVTGGEPFEPGSNVVVAWQLCPAHDASGAVAVAHQHSLDVAVGRAVAPEHARLSRISAEARLKDFSGNNSLYAAPRAPQVRWADHDSPVLTALLEFGPPPHALATAILGPLIATDPPAHAELVTLRHTLQVFLQHNAQRAPAAATLGVHRNTLRDRLDRIEQLLQRNLDHPTDRAEIWLALQLWQQATPANAAASQHPPQALPSPLSAHPQH